MEVTLRGRLGETKRTMLVDTFATHTWISTEAAERLGARTLRRISAETTSGATVERTLGELEIEIEGEAATVPVVFGEENDLEAIGRTTLAVLLLEPDMALASVRRQPYAHVTHPPVDFEKLERAVIEGGEKDSAEAKPKAFWITVTMRADFRAKALQFDKHHFDADLLKGDVRVPFDGRSPFIPGTSPLVTNEGAVRSVPIINFLWNLIAACDRLLARSMREVVDLSPSFGLQIDFHRLADDVDIRLRREGAILKRVLAEKRLAMGEMAETVAMLSNMQATILADMNPELRGNPMFTRFAQSAERLWAKKPAPGPPRG